MNPPYPASLFSRPSLCIISVFPLPLCVQFNQQARSHSYRHHAILVLILMPISLLPLPRHAPLFFFFFVQDPFFPHFFYCGWECSVAIATIISAFLPVAHATHNAPSSSFPRIERSVSLTPSHALQFPPLSLFRYPALHFYVAVLVLVHLFFSSPPAFLTVSAINRGVRPPTRNLARHAPWSNGARFVSTTQWVRLFPLENTWKRYGRYHGSSGRWPNAATTRMARLNKYRCDTNHRSCIDRNPSRASRIRQGARGPARWTRSRGSELRTWPVCKNTSEAATVCTQTTIILPFADCPLRPPDRASRVAPQEKKLRTVHRACFFPTQLKTHTRSPQGPSLLNSNSKFNSNPNTNSLLSSLLFPSSTCLCARANHCLAKAPKERQMWNMRAGCLRAYSHNSAKSRASCGAAAFQASRGMFSF